MASGFVAAVGSWCFRHRWLVVSLWLVAVLGGALASGPVFSRLADATASGSTESAEGLRRIAAGTADGGQILALVDGVDVPSSGVRDVVNRLVDDLGQNPAVLRVDPPYAQTPQAARQIAADRRALIVTIVLKSADPAAKSAVIDDLTVQLHSVEQKLRAAGQQSAVVKVGGNAALNRETNRAVQSDVQRAELISLPITLLVLIVVFGGIVAASMPVLAAVVSMAGSMLLLLGFSTFVDLDQNVVTVTTLLGLGLSIDYGLLLVARVREELLSGVPVESAVSRAWATAGRTIMFSALTVAGALTGLLAFEVTQLRALAAAGISIAVVAMLTALTFTAALLGLVGRWIKPSRHRQRRVAAGAASDERGFFAALSRLVQRRAGVVAALTVALLLLAGSPLLGAVIKFPQLENLPDSIEAKQVATALQDRFNVAQRPAVRVVATGDAAGLQRWATGWAADPAVAAVGVAQPISDTLASVQFEVKGEPQGAEAQGLVHRLRSDRPDSGQSWVIGDTAVLVDTLSVIRKALPLGIAITVLAMLVLLFAMTGSVIVPIKAVLANAVSLGATFGVMVAVFEHGYLAGPLNMLVVGGLDPFVIVIVVAFAFGLSMDYEVFLLGRIKEYVEAGHDSDTAVRRGLQQTGRIITSAALLMVIVFVCFASGRTGSVQQLGLGLTLSVLVDATIVRCLLVPATMTLLGGANWWAPQPLRRLHERFGLRERTLPPVSPAASQTIENRAPADAVRRHGDG
ncbi:putative membrane protein [Micromonospora sonchi]|uniref:Membrane protein n=1 Tax=Micromonospora sonchi TaxID=1763543 RepID=A0A917U168_9ACTN|nr:MMPL family transporter [Micromonospora sonchi]GGM47393.1 putative membrane protein [Micromonospora sonchi]